MEEQPAPLSGAYLLLAIASRLGTQSATLPSEQKAFMGKALVVIVECDQALLASQILLFEAQGHQVFSARTRQSAEQYLNGHCPDAIVLGHSLQREDREVLVAKSRLIRPDTSILVLHASGADLPVIPDAAIDSREGPISVLVALQELLDHGREEPPEKELGSQNLPKQYRTQS
jgi:DNA-binding NtrC family response regulator